MITENPKFVKSISRCDKVYYQYYYKGWFYIFPLNMDELQNYGTTNITSEINKFKEDIDNMLHDMEQKNYRQLSFTDYDIDKYI